MKREVVEIKNPDFDFTSKKSFEIDGNLYEFVTDFPSRQSDGEDHNMVFKRQSDGKLFKFFWWYHHSSGDYIFEEREMVECFEKIKITYE